jgi:TolB-like protein/class 3 adenylate cyclase
VAVVPDTVGTSRILTLVFTDLADSTALKTARGDRAIGELITRHRAHVERLAAESGGRIVGWAGDGCFLVFETPSAAVLFALRLQQAHGDERDLPGVRTGIHMGEVSERRGSGGDVEGLAVDLAGRIAGLARPAQVLVSASVADSARPRLDRDAVGRPIRWQSHGSYRLKGFDDALEIREVGIDGVAPFVAPSGSDKAVPTRSTASRSWTVPATIVSLMLLGAAVAYLFRSPASESVRVVRPVGVERPAGDALTISAFAGRPALAVLPFDNLSPDPEQAYFADGLAEDLITRLSAWRAFPVIARNSSFHYRGGNLDLKRVGDDLGARYLVEGSVRRVGDRIRVTAQLIDAPTGDHVWSEGYDREVKDVFAVQDEISSTIAASIAGDVNRVEAERARQRGTENLEAWSLYEMAWPSVYRFTRDGNAEARRLLQRAVALDPDFAEAIALLSITHSWDVAYGWSEAPEHSLAAALESAHRAVELDPRNPTAHAALGAAYLLKGDLRAGLDSTQRAVDLNPSMPGAWIWLAWAQLLSGDPDGCIASNKNAQRLDPQGETASIAWDGMAMAYWEKGRYGDSLDAAHRLIAARPDYWWGPLYLALNAVSLGHNDEARAAIAEARRLNPGLSIAQIQRGLGVLRPEVDARRNAALREAGLE